MMTDVVAARAEATFRRAVAFHQQSRLDEARASYQEVLRFDPRHFQSLHLLGVIALQKNEAAAAVELFGRALLIEPANVFAHVNFGSAQQELRRFDDALVSYDRAIELKPDCAEAFFNRGNVLRQLERYRAAIESHDRAIALKPNYADAFLNRGLAFSDLAQHEAAIRSYDRAIEIQPGYAEAHYNRGNSLHSLRRFEAAVAAFDKAVSCQPSYADAYLNRGSALVQLRRHTAALASYDRAIHFRPAHAESHFNRGGVLQHLGQYAAAVASYDTAIALRTNHAEAHANRGRALRELKRYEEAIASYDKAISLQSGAADLRCVRRHIKMQICDWSDLDPELTKITLDIDGAAASPNPFYVMTLCDSAALQKKAAENWVRKECPLDTSLGEIPRRGRTDRIHIAYFSADFHEHATSYLIAQLLELHDRSRFRVSAFSFGTPSQCAMRKRLQTACEEFTDVHGQSDADIAMLARKAHVDLAVDLKGFTQDNRAGIFALRAAPVQVNYLGYPGTMGAPYIDYLIADRTLVPPGGEAHYTEKIVYLPHSYQVNDAKRAIDEKTFTRAECGLPPAAFVYCCFNNSYKILPQTFDAWMRILTRVPGSVLWLLGDNAAAIRHLRREAAARQVDPQRLTFADRIPLPKHLARHRAADLFIDTMPCNAHTTASDALWAGLPVLTCAGEAFAGRVAASLLTAIGLPELVASTPQHYEELAVRLAAEPQALADIRRRLSDNRLVAPLFDTLLYTLHLESAFALMYERYQADLPREHLYIRSN